MNKMNHTWKFTAVVSSFFLIVAGICAASVNANPNQPPKLIQVKEGDNFTLPCHPDRQNSDQVPTGRDFEWVMNDALPIYSNGRLQPFMRIYLHDVNNDAFAIDNSTLIVRRFEFSEGIDTTFTCRLPRLRTNFTYVIKQISQSRNNFKIITSSYAQIKPPNAGKPVVLPCPNDSDYNQFAAGTSYMWVWQRKKNNSSFVKVISLNQRVLVRNNSARFRIAENRSLIISNYKFTPRTQYKCYLSSGSFAVHFTSSPFHFRGDDYDDDGDNEGQIEGLIKPTLLVTNIGARDLVLKCPVLAKQNEYEWIAKRGTEIYPDVLVLNGENFTPKRCVPKCYETDYKINNDGSLTIRIVTDSILGTYTCRNRISGELFAYNVTRKTDVKSNKVVLVEQGKNVTLPCPMNHPMDRELDLIIWNIKLKNVSSSLMFVEGKMIPRPNMFSLNDLTRNVNKLADDKESLVVSNFHPNLIGNYTCSLMYSGTKYSYTLNLKTST